MPVSSMSTEMAMCGVFVRLREVVDEGLGVLRLERDDPRELALVVRVVGVEALRDELGVVVVLGEDDGLAEPVAARHLCPRVIRCSSTLSTVSLLKSHRLTASASTRSGTLPSSSHSSASHCSFSSSDRSSYVMPSRWNLSGTDTARAGTRNPSLHRLVERRRRRSGTPFSRSKSE